MRFPRFVYAIQHKVTKKIYVGSSHTPEQRYMSHIYALRNNSHPVGDMQVDFERYGENFTFYILDRLENWEDRNREYAWMRRFKSYDRQYGYNYKDNAVCQLFGSKIPYGSGLPEIVFREDKEGLSEEKMRKELIDFIERLTPEQVEKLYSRLDEIKAKAEA